MVNIKSSLYASIPLLLQYLRTAPLETYLKLNVLWNRSRVYFAPSLAPPTGDSLPLRRHPLRSPIFSIRAPPQVACTAVAAAPRELPLMTSAKFLDFYWNQGGAIPFKTLREIAKSPKSELGAL